GGHPLPVLISPVVDGRFGATAVLGIPERDRTDAVIAERLSMPGTSPAHEPSGAGAAPSPLTSSPRPAVRYKADDFSISRQRSWGTPIPIVYCESCGAVPIEKEQLPVLLPLHITPTGTGNPLAELREFVETSCPRCGGQGRRETDTLDCLSDGEPFAGCLFHEMVINEGRKMSKHLGNVVDPDALVERYGADTVRLALLYAARPQRSLNWSDSAVLRCHRFLTQLWEYC